MPVIDDKRKKGSATIAAKAMASGEIDWNEPYAGNRKDESRLRKRIREEVSRVLKARFKK